MTDKEFNTLCARINSALDVKKIIDMIDYHPDRAIQVAGLWRMLCPVHGDRVFRTLVINPRRNTYHCEHTPCRAHQPGDLIDLLAKIKNSDKRGVVVEIIEVCGADNLKLTPKQEESLRQYATRAS